MAVDAGYAAPKFVHLLFVFIRSCFIGQGVPCYTLFIDDYPLSSTTKVLKIIGIYKYNRRKIYR